MSVHSFRFPTKISFGNGSLDMAIDLLNQKKVRRPLIVTDKALSTTSVFEKLKTLLSDFDCEVYADAEGNPLFSHVTQGVACFKKHDADAVISMGGGCALDVAKAIALMAHHPGELADYEDGKPDGRPIFADRIPYTIAIPTTSGTGSEVGGSSVVSRDEDHAKVIIWGNELVPHNVLADPSLTTSLPKHMTAATGIDALTHNVEAFLAKNYHPMCDGIALEGIRLIQKSLVKAYEEPGDLEARSDMLLASMMGATAFQKGLGVTHSCAHSLSTCFDLHHGLANALMLDVCMKFNLESVPERFVSMGHTLGFEGRDDAKVEGFFTWVRTLKSTLGIPSSLKDVGVEVTDRLVDVAFQDVCHQNNPRTCTREDFTKLFEAAL